MNYKKLSCIGLISFLLFLMCSCSKQPVDYSKDINDLKALVSELQHRSDSLGTALGNTNTNLSNLSKSVDSIKIKLTDIQTQIDALNLSLTTANANIAAINAQLLLLNQQYASLLAQLNAILALLNATPTTLSDGLVAYYPFSGNAGDSSGNGNHGTNNGARLTTDRLGNYNKAYEFDGTNDINIPHNSILNITGNISVSLWFNSYDPGLLGDYHTFISKRSQAEFGNVPYIFGINYQQFGFPDGHKKLYLASAKNDIYQILNSPNDITNGIWNNVTYTINGNNLKIYLNGIEISNQTIDNSLRVTNNAPLLIGSGSRLDKPAEQMNGKLDDIRIYNRVLTQSEITFLANH